MKRHTHRCRIGFLAAIVASALCSQLFAAELFSEGFDSSAANVKVNRSADSAVDYVDYSAFTVGQSSFFITEAPNMVPGSAPNHGVLMRVNHTGQPGGTGARAAINMLAGATPINFSGNYAVSYDVYMNISNPNGIGSTQQALFGLGTNDDATLEAALNRGVAGPDPVGTWGWLTNDNESPNEDAAINQNDVELADIGDNNAADVVAGVSPRLFNQAFDYNAPTLNHSAAGQWVNVDLRTYQGRVSVWFNGVRFFGNTKDPIISSTAASGFAMLGLEDPFASISQSPDLEWALFDNFVVKEIPPAPYSVFEWEYVNPRNPGLGKQRSAEPASGGVGLLAAPGVNANGKNLDHAYLVGADLTNSSFDSANLTRAALDGANLTNANLNHANLTAASLNGTNLTGAFVQNADFASTHITLDQLHSSASYQTHNMTGIGLAGNDISGADFSGQTLTSANFYAAKLVGADLTNADLTNAELVNADLSQANLTNANFYGATLALANLSGANLIGANFNGSYLIGTNFAGANIHGAILSRAEYHVITDYGCGPKTNGAPCHYTTQIVGTGISLAQLVSTASYAARDLSGTTFGKDDFTGANFAGFNLTNTNFTGTTLDGADLSGADARGSVALESFAGPNFIQSNGHIAGINLSNGQTLLIRDYDGNPSVATILVDQQFVMATSAKLRMIFDADAWNSTILFAAGIPVTRGGTLDLAFADGVIPAGQIGRTFDLFDWTGVTPTGTFAISSPYNWDLSDLYTTGEITLLAAGGGGGAVAPEPTGFFLLGVGIVALGMARSARRARPFASFFFSDRRFFLILVLLSLFNRSLAAAPNVQITKIANPVWKPVDFQLFSAPATPFNQQFGNVYNTILPYDTPLATTYVPHAPPYDTELSAGVQAGGYVNQTVFTPDAITLHPNGVYLAFMLVPDPGVNGSSRDFASGPVIPNSLFPIADNNDVWLDGVLVDQTPGADSVIPVQPRDVGKDGTSHLELLQAFWHPWDDDLTVGPLGSYELRASVRDVGGAGWDIVAPFQVVAALPGDYNGNGVVDAADFTVWRDHLGGVMPVNRGLGFTGPVGQADYDFWKLHFGDTSAGAAAFASASPAVPEPNTMLLMLLAATGLIAHLAPPLGHGSGSALPSAEPDPAPGTQLPRCRVPAAGVPEPSTMLLMLLAAMGGIARLAARRAR